MGKGKNNSETKWKYLIAVTVSAIHVHGYNIIHVDVVVKWLSVECH